VESGEAENVVAVEAPVADAHAERATRRLAAALGPRAGHVVVTGPTAKDAEALLGRVESDIVAYRCAWVDGRRLDAPHVLRAFGLDDPDVRTAPAAFRRLCAEARGLGRPVVLVVTDACAAPPGTLEALRLMIEGGPDALESLRFVLAGGPALLAALRRPEARALATRVTTIVEAPDAPATVTLPVTTSLTNAPARSRGRRWPRPRRILAAATLGSAFAAAVAPVVVPQHAPAPVSIAAEPAASEPAAVAPEPPAPPLAEALPPVEATPPLAADASPPAADATASPAADPPPPQAVVHDPPPASPKLRSVQVAAFRDPAHATALRDELAERFEWVMVTEVERDGVVWHRVRVEGLPDRAAVNAALTTLRRSGHQPIVVR
jgi:cell division protein FtsN